MRSAHKALTLAATAFWPAWMALRCLAPEAAQAAAEATPFVPLFGAGVLCWSLAAIGARLLPPSDPPASATERTALGMLVGWCLLSVATFVLAALHALSCLTVGLLFTLAAGVSWCLPSPLRGAPSPAEAIRRARQATPVQAGMATAVGLLLAFSLLGSLAPTTDSDSLLYHLGVPAQYVRAGGFVYIPQNLWSNTPLFAETLNTAALAVMNQTLARLFTFASYALVLALVYALVRRHFPHADALAATLLAGSIPLLAILGSTAYNDPMLIAYALGGLLASVNSRQSRSPGWFPVGCVLLGAAASIKYAGFVWLGLLVPAGAISLVRHRPKGWRPQLLIGVALAAVLPGLWLLKNGVCTGNPVFPLAYGLLDGRDWSADLAARYYEHMRGFGLREHGVLGVLAAPVAIVLEDITGRKSFGPAIGIGPLYLLALPLFFWIRGAGRLALWMRLLVVLLYLAWALSVQHLRYLLPGLVVYAVVIAESAGRLVDRPPSTPRSAAHLVILLAGLAHFLWFAAVQQKEFRPQQGVFGVAARARYLSASKSMTYYDTVQYANRTLSQEDRILFVGEWRTFYTEIPFVADAGPNGATIARYVTDAATPEEAVRRLRADGFTHLLVNWSSWDTLNANFGYLPYDTDVARRTMRVIGMLPLAYFRPDRAVLLRTDIPSAAPGQARDADAGS